LTKISIFDHKFRFIFFKKKKMGEIGENGGIGPVRRKRCRIKGLVKEVIKQLEFYFSEPNLRRDLIFRKLAGNNGTKPVSILQFMKFDKIKELTQDVQVSIL